MGLRLQCTVCQGQYCTKKEWLGHLMEPQHQVPARQAIGSWQVKSMRNSALVVFSKKSVGEDDRLIQYFSRDLGTYVTDFVWEPERPKVGFIQFDSSQTLRKVLTPVKDHQVEVDGHMFQVKEAESYTDFEWEGLLPAMANCDKDWSDSESDSSNETEIHIDCSVDCEHGKVNGNGRPGQIEDVTAKAKDNPVTPGETIASEQKPKLNLRTQNGNSPILSSGSGGTLLLQQLESIQKLTEIPEEEHTSVLRLVTLLQQTFSKFRPNMPMQTFEVILSRNWALKLKYRDPDSAADCNNPPFIFVQTRGSKLKRSPIYNYKLLGLPILGILKHPQDRQKSQGLFHSVTRAVPRARKEKELVLNFMANDSSLRNLPPVKLTGDRDVNLDTQLWRLIDYSSTFDSRCEHLLAVIYYWANLNSIQLASEDSKQNAKKSLRGIPDPFGITWLLILFLCKEGHLPLPQLLLSRSKRMPDSLRFKSKDVGVLENKEFASAWMANNETRTRASKGSEAFALEVFTLAADFFLSFGQRLREGNWVIDSQTAEILKPEEFLKLRCQLGEMTSVKAMLNDNAKSKVPYRLHLINPFAKDWRIRLGNSTEPYEAMLRTGKRLKEALQTYNLTKGVGLDFLQLFKN